MTIRYTALPSPAFFDRRITAQELRTLCIVGYYGSLSDKAAYASYNTLAMKAGISRRQVMRQIKHLWELGYLTKENRVVEGKQTTNIYTVPLHIMIAPDLGDKVDEEAGPGRFGSAHHLGIAMEKSKLVEARVVTPGDTTPSDTGRHPGGDTGRHPNHITLNKNNKKNINKKNPKLTLDEWEAKTGSVLCTAMMSSWIKAARADEAEVATLIAEFRDKVLAGGNVYADFVAAFRNWLRQGYLSKTMAQVQQKGAREARDAVRVHDTRTSL